MPFELWRRWLFVASVLFAAFGLLVAFHPFGAPFEGRNAAIAEAFFGGRWTLEGRAYHAFSSGPLGGTVAGFYLLQAFLVAVPFKRREPWAWHATVWATLLWFLVDSAVSLRHGAAFNIYMVNVVPLAIFGLPLAATFRAFYRRRGVRGGDPAVDKSTTVS